MPRARPGHPTPSTTCTRLRASHRSNGGKLGGIVSTKQGKLEGENNQWGESFKGIPFARPPINGLRFRAPEPPESWRGSRPATSFGPAAPQVGPVNRMIRGLIGAAGSRQSQDCLYLNVWTPACDSARRPVLVWIHGGAFILGSGSTPIYAGGRLASHGDVVVVTINYRLGVLGFLDWRGLHGRGDHPPANLGVRDQIAALEWVGENIEAFGGDPENVTLFGESAGAMSIGTLLGVPSARNLFHKAILQSGAAHNISTEAKSKRVTEYFVESLELNDPSPETIAELPVLDLMQAQARTTLGIGLDDGMMAWQPCIDGDLIPEQPLVAIDRGDAAEIPILIGTNRDEFKLFTFADRGRMDDAEFVERLQRIARKADAGEDRVVERLMGTYGPRTGERRRDGKQRWVALQSDRIFHYPATRLADAQSAHQPDTYTYLFEWMPPVVGRALGACHGLELPFVFGGVRSVLMRAGLVIDRSAGPLSDSMQEAWTSFARTGQPDLGESPDWPAYESRRHYTMSLGGKRGVLKDPHEGARKFWEPLIPNGEVSSA
ncbi:MAG: carboxylesterase [Deltaproteobacteria bacterium]|nr:carboxylesterase [Deltaproteobacteria bacterium]